MDYTITCPTTPSWKIWWRPRDRRSPTCAPSAAESTALLGRVGSLGPLHQGRRPGHRLRVGKRTTARLLTAELNSRGLTSELIYTGQTGWMQGGPYGIIFDSLMVDFAAGELEGAILACAADVDPDVMVIEGRPRCDAPGVPVVPR